MAPGPVRRGDRSEIILVVEDDPLVRRATAEALNELGYIVHDCDSAANAFRSSVRKTVATVRTTPATHFQASFISSAT
jgi:CheY-like chemotaxis protein